MPRKRVAIRLQAGIVYNPGNLPESYSALLSEELVRVCASGADPAAWEEFVRRFHRLIASVILRTARRWGESPRALVDDLIQETYLKLCKDRCRLLRKFEPRQADSIYGFLKVVATNVVHDHFKSTHAHKRTAAPEGNEAAARSAGTEGGPGDAVVVERKLLLEEVDDCLRRCAAGPDQARNRSIFWLYYRHGFSARSIAALSWIALTTEGVESAILRLTRTVREELAQTRGVAEQKKSRQEKEGFRRAESF